MVERMTEAEFNSLLIRRVNRDGTAERLCSVAHAEITALRAEVDNLKSMAIAQEKLLRSKDAENERLTAEVEKLRAALEPFADMGKAMMGRKHPNEAVVQYALAPTIKVFHLVAAHEARDAITQEARDE